MSDVAVAWDETVIGRHFEDPYSAEALAEPDKEVIDIGAVDFANIPRDYDAHLFGDRILKASDTMTLTPGNRRGSSALMDAHELFMGVAKEIMGFSRHRRSQVVYISHCEEVPADGFQRYADKRHLDGYRFRADDRKIRLIGMAFDVLPTHAYQGPYTPEDVHEEDERGGIEAGDLRSTTNTEALIEMPILECGRLLLFPPSLPHAGRVATETTDRHFMRWTVWL